MTKGILAEHIQQGGEFLCFTYRYNRGIRLIIGPDGKLMCLTRGCHRHRSRSSVSVLRGWYRNMLIRIQLGAEFLCFVHGCHRNMRLYMYWCNEFFCVTHVLHRNIRFHTDFFCSGFLCVTHGKYFFYFSEIFPSMPIHKIYNPSHRMY